MKQLLLVWALVCLLYFGWRYAPPRAKFFAWQFVKAHAFWLIAIIGTIIGALFWQSGTSTKLF